MSSASPAPDLKLEVLDGGIGQLTFDQPGSRANTLGQAVLGELEGSWRTSASGATCAA